jgi:hypothetical protein
MDPTILSFVTGAVGAFIAAWAGAYVGFRRGRKERALDRKLAWHEGAIQSLAQYEEQLERLRSHALNFLVIQPSRDPSRPKPAPRAEDVVPSLFKAPAPLWIALQEAEGRARAALRLGDLYTEGRAQLDCSVALSSSVNMVASHWMDISAEPQVPWADLQVKASAAANVRRSLQESLKLVLELDGILARLLGPRYRQWRTLRQLKRLNAEVTQRAS